MPSRRASAELLVVDDDPTTCEFIAKALKREGYGCTTAQTGAEAFEAAQKRSFDLLLLDLRLPDTDGLQLLYALREQKVQVPAIIITAHPSLPTAIEALSREVRNYLPKPFKPAQLMERVRNALADESGMGSEYLWDNLETKYNFRHVLSRSPRVRRTYLTAAKSARSRAPILIQGESGTGKEFLARAIHYLSDRAGKPFVVLNCGAFPQELLESELFGHEKGAFTSATAGKPGLCEMADGGTLFLDEIGDMTLPMQVKLLRFIQDGSFRRLGSTEEGRVDVRIIAATNQDLPAAMKAGRFREDLYWRINVVHLHLSPLRERPEDLEPFSSHFLAEFAQELEKRRLELSPEALEKLRSFSWPGNIRQLHNVLLRAALLADTPILRPEHIVFDELSA